MPRAARAQAEPEPSPKPLTPLGEATAEHGRAEGALARAEALLAEAQRRKADTEAGIAAATEATRKAGLALADDPDAEGLLDDCVMEMTRLQARLRALEAQTIPTAEAAVASRRAEMETAREAYVVQARREAIRTELLPVDGRLVRALAEAVEALQACRRARIDLSRRGLQPKNMTGTWSDVPSSIVPTELASLTRAQVQQSTVYGSQPLIHFPSTGADHIANMCRTHNIDPATIPEEPALAEPGEQP